MRITKNSAHLIGLAVSAALLASSCSPGSDEAQPDKASTTDAEDSEELSSDSSDGSKGPDVGTAEDGFLETVEVRTDLEDTTPVDVLEVTSNDTELVLTFEMGSQQCYGVDASVDEGDSEVVLNVQTGRLPEASEACVEGVYPYQVSIPLGEALDDRPIRQAEPEEPAEEPMEEPAAQALASGKPSVDHLMGLPVEEGVQWAIENELEWQLSSYGGVAREVGSKDENRLSFEVESDKIVGIEWA